MRRSRRNVSPFSDVGVMGRRGSQMDQSCSHDGSLPQVSVIIISEPLLSPRHCTLQELIHFLKIPMKSALLSIRTLDGKQVLATRMCLKPTGEHIR